MNDLISRQAAIDAIGEKPFAGTADEYDYEQGLQNQWERDVVAIKILPSVESERIAKVIEHDASITDTDGYKYHRSEYLCDACKKRVLGGDEYCSHCGARLDWSNDE